jgi:hypothetical protein
VASLAPQLAGCETGDCLDLPAKFPGDFTGSPDPDSKLQIHIRLGYLHPGPLLD